ncbi:MAG: hypothetical protein JO320_04570 [Alphaproteobacteria bacterium]|nr:hypothetical protein [Alphaproteobacteria bacterium]MBV9374322.1 hypothetical protein [Alphaproteobacteria bacterium]
MSIQLAPTSMRSIRAARKAHWRVAGSSGQLFTISSARVISPRCAVGRRAAFALQRLSPRRGPAVHAEACKHELEGIVSKRADAAYAPRNRGIWLKVKCLFREKFVVVGWTDPEGRRPYLGTLLLRLLRSERKADLCRPRRHRHRRARAVMAAAAAAHDRQDAARWPPPRGSRFGSPLRLSRVHWVRPALVAEVKFLTWTEENLLRQVVYEGLREDSRQSRCVVHRRIRSHDHSMTGRAYARIRGAAKRSPAQPARPNAALSVTNRG